MAGLIRKKTGTNAWETVEDTGGMSVDGPLDMNGNYLVNLPTADPQVAGALWNNNGVPQISDG